ncbi:MAG: hypothetical protein JW791_03900 [Nanoarchaeota archaeon]|nr:hypothetical protein [Nanoarchaeota archaeon]
MVIKTSIPKLDEITSGGLTEGSTAILWSKPGVENAPFAYKTIIQALKNHASVAYLVNNKSPKMVRKELLKGGWDSSKYENHNKLFFIDSYSKLFNQSAKNKFFVEEPKKIKSVIESINTCFKDVKGKKLLVIDDLSTIFHLCGTRSMKEILLLKKELNKKKITTLFMFTEWPYEKRVINDIRRLNDVVVNINAFEDKVIIRKYYSVETRKKSIAKEIPFEITSKGVLNHK